MRRDPTRAATGPAPYRNRRAAGQLLADALAHLLSADERERAAAAAAPPVVIALPRGGVPVAFEVAERLHAPLDVLLARKIGAPGNPELGIGAVAEGGVRVLSEEAIASLMVSEQELEHGVRRAEEEVQERMRLYRAGRLPVSLSGRTAVLVDDGLATGGTARAAIAAAYARGAAHVILAVPVGASSTVERLRKEADAVICLLTPEPMWAIGMWYRDFSQVSDLEVMGLLARARGREKGWGAADEADGAATDGAASAGQRWDATESGEGASEAGDPEASADCDGVEVEIPFEAGKSATGDLVVPSSASALVLFAHGSGSSRRSPRNRQVASALNEQGIATLLFDLLTPSEELQRANIFDVALLASRLVDATRWAQRQPSLEGLQIGYFGASTGAAAALWAAAELRGDVGAVVSRGGRPDLAASRLPEVSAPTLLIVGGADVVVLDLNRQALGMLRCASELQVVAHATHLFEERGALEQVSGLAGDWFLRHLAETTSTTR